ncbi:hypothetical protein Tco_0917604, partial [Tanacetum coccineum]
MVVTWQGGGDRLWWRCIGDEGCGGEEAAKVGQPWRLMKKVVVT